MKTSPIEYHYSDPQESRLERAESVLSDTREALARNSVQIDTLAERMDQGFQRISKNLDKIDGQLAGIGQSLAQQEPRISRLEEREQAGAKRKALYGKTVLGAVMGAAGFLVTTYWPSIVGLFHG